MHLVHKGLAILGRQADRKFHASPTTEPAVSGHKWAGVEFWVFVLIAEYAATIRTIPPTELSKSGAFEAPIGS